MLAKGQEAVTVISMSAVWGVAVILERFFENTHIVHPQNIGENGRIVIDKGRKETVGSPGWQWPSLAARRPLGFGR